MNKTQKSAIFCLVTFLFCVAVMAYPFISIFMLKNWPESFFSRFWSAIAYFVFMAASIIFLRKKQSPTEVDSDERDDLIKKRAVLTAFVSVWILLFASSILLRFIVGPDGSIPVWTLPIVNLGVFFFVILFHSVAILTQYGLEGKDGEG
jgi:O-antigen/teichoic acid export membrane protein